MKRFSKFDEDVDYDEYGDYGNVDYAAYAAAAEGVESGAAFAGDYPDLFSAPEAKSADDSGPTVAPPQPQVITTPAAAAADTPRHHHSRKQPYSFVTPSVYDMFEGNSINFEPADDDFEASDPIMGLGNVDYEALRL